LFLVGFVSFMSHGWTAALWAVIGAWIASFLVVCMSLAISLGLGTIGLFAGSLDGFTRFSISVQNLHWLFWSPLTLIAALFLLRIVNPPIKQSPSLSTRIAVALASAVVGGAIMIVIALSLVRY
jgi:hypothetical protein